jgi:hypothetical protein
MKDEKVWWEFLYFITQGGQSGRRGAGQQVQCGLSEVSVRGCVLDEQHVGMIKALRTRGDIGALRFLV